MSRFLNTRGGQTLAIAICGRCRMKRCYDELRQDPNCPGLFVCAGCVDEADPYLLPPRKPESITLKHPRPDTKIDMDTEWNIQIGEPEE